MSWPEPAPARPLWLVTLADLALLLVGFLVLIHASRDPKAVVRALQASFAAEPPPPMPVAAQRVAGFAPGDATAGVSPAVVAWAAEQLRDPRVALTVTGSVDGTAADVDRATRSPSLLAADRARAVAARLAPLAPARIGVATSITGGQRAVTVTLAFAGERKLP
jgi:hypothetical protein